MKLIAEHRVSCWDHRAHEEQGLWHPLWESSDASTITP